MSLCVRPGPWPSSRREPTQWLAPPARGSWVAEPSRAILYTVRVLILSLLVCCACSVPTRTGSAGADRGPNIIVILADDLGHADVGFHGLTDFATPNIDRLAASGARFTDAYVTHPYCSPSRAGLLTGRYQHRFGHIHNPKFRAGDGLPLSETLLPEVLSQAGYVTGIVGKWHLGDAPPFRPRQRGFDEFFGILGGGHDYFRSAGPDAREYLIPLKRNDEDVPVEGCLTQQLSDAGVDFVRRHSESPFFLYLSYNAPHGPLQAPSELEERFQSIEDPRRRTYAAMVTSVDDGVGDITEAIGDLSLTERTLLFFLSDNGGPPFANASDNSPLRGVKGTVYEGGVRVPFVLAWPGRVSPGTVYDLPVSALDIFPTAVASAGANVPSNLDGVDLMPHLSGSATGPPHEHLYWYAAGGDQYAIRTQDRKLVRTLTRDPELYDIQSDISESVDISAEDGSVAELESALDAWHATHPRPQWLGTARDRPISPNTVTALSADQSEIDAWLAVARP